MITEDPKHQDIHEYLAEFEDIPGTRVYTAARARKEKEELLGKVEAALWRKDRSAEPPMGLSTMSTSELREVLAALEAPAAKAPKQGDP